MNAMNDIHKKVLRKFHTLCSVCGMTQDEKRALVLSYGVESSADISTHDLIDICGRLSEQADAKTRSLNRLRRQVMAAIGGYLRMTGREESSAVIIGIACRATGYREFNKIPEERLRNIYNAFVNKQKDARRVDEIAQSLAVARIFNHNAAEA